MKTPLDPVIADKLAAFGRRWRRLTLLRGACEGVVTLLGAMTLVALLDRLVFLSDAVRVCLSAAAYLSAATVVWLQCVRPLLNAPGPRELARLMEKARPDLREDLLSAVELGEAEPDEILDSQQFRSIVQQDLAARVKDLQPARLLPNRLVSRWLYTATGAVALCGLLLILPGLHYDTLLARAFAPMADVERVSLVKLRIIEPTPAELTAPRGDTIPVVVEVEGPVPEKIILETFREGEKTERDRTMMSQVGARQFSAGISAGAETVFYRVRGGDAITRKYAIRTRPRPQVIMFQKTFQFPAYTGLPASVSADENGDISALEGTEVALKLSLDQPVSQAELRIEHPGGMTRVPLSVVGERQLQGSLTIRTQGVYQVHLVSTETGFENKFSPQYEIRPAPDVVPIASIDAPDRDRVAQADEVIELRGYVRDDVAVASVAQMVQVNDGPWTQIPLPGAGRGDIPVFRKWDLIAHQLKPGDRVATKLVARDVKGNLGESAPRQLMIGSAGLDPRRLNALKEKGEFHQALDSVRQTADELRDQLSKDAGDKSKMSDDLLRKQTVLNARASADELQRRIEQAWGELEEALPQASPGREAGDLALAGRMLSQIEEELLPAALAEVDAMAQTAASGEPLSNVRKAADEARRLSDRARELEQKFKDMLLADQAGLIAENLNYLRQEQEQMHRQAAAASNAPEALSHLARRQAGAAGEFELAEGMLAELSQKASSPFADNSRRIKNNLQTNRQALEKAAGDKPGKEFESRSRTMERAASDAFNNFSPVEKDLARRADEARQQLQKSIGQDHSRLASLRKDLEELASTQSRLSEEKQKGRPLDRLQAREQELKSKTDAAWKSAAEMLEDRATVEEMRPDADPHFVADATKAAQALSAMKAASEGGPVDGRTLKKLKNLEEAFRMLEAGHQIADIESGLKSLAKQERYEQKAMESQVGRARDWEWLNNRMQALPRDWNKSVLPEGPAQMVAQAAKSSEAQEVGREMSQRPAARRDPKPVPDQLEQLGAEVGEARHQLQPRMEHARSVLAGAAPALSDMMKGLARAAEQMETATREAMATSKEDVQKEEARQLLARQRELGEQVDDLKAAVRRDANVQDLSDAKGRDRARDADDAVAMLREPPPKAEDALAEASMARDAASQSKALNSAATQQQKLAETLKQLGQHYANLEAGRGDETRTALRKAEEELGVKGMLDNEYAKAEKLSEMASKSPKEMLESLEKELAADPAMRKELDNIADQAAEGAMKALQQAAREEQEIARSLEGLAKAQDSRASMAEQAKAIARQAGRMAKDDVPSISMEAQVGQAALQPELNRASQALQQAASKAPSDFSKPVSELAAGMADLASALQQAGTDLKAAADKASQAVKQAQAGDPKTVAAQAAQSQAAKASKDASAMAQQAARMADTLKAMAGESSSQLAQAAARQGPIASGLEKAGDDLSRAGRHESRLGTMQGDAFQQIGKQTQAVAGQEVPNAQKALESGHNPATARNSVEAAKAAVENQLNALQTAMQLAPSSASSGQPSAAQQGQAGEQGQAGHQAQRSADESKSMARTLDRLDAALNSTGKPGQQGQQQSAESAASNAMQDAAQAQRASMMSARRDGGVPGEMPSQDGTGAGSLTAANQGPVGALPQLRAARDGAWGNLPPKLAQDLTEGRRENLSGEYRDMVETYFKVVAEKARK